MGVVVVVGVVVSVGVGGSYQLKEEDPMFKCFFLYPKSRLALYKRLDLSCEEMVLGGLLQETEALLDLGLKPGEGTATNAVGYKQFMKYLRKCRDERRKGESSRATMKTTHSTERDQMESSQQSSPSSIYLC